MPYIDAGDASPPKEEPSTKASNGASSRNSSASAATTTSYATPASSHQPQSTSASPQISTESIRPPLSRAERGHSADRRIIQLPDIFCDPYRPTPAPPVLPPPAIQTPTSFKDPAARALLPPQHDAFLNRSPVKYRSYRDTLPEPNNGAGSSASPTPKSRAATSAAKQPPAPGSSTGAVQRPASFPFTIPTLQAPAPQNRIAGPPGSSTGAVQRPAPFPFTIPTLHAPAPHNRIVGLPDSAPCHFHRFEPPYYLQLPPQLPEPTPRTPHPPPSPTPHFPQPPPLSSGWGYGHPGPDPSTSPHRSPPMSARHAAFVEFASPSPRPYTHSPYTHPAYTHSPYTYTNSSTVFAPPPPSPQAPPYQYYQHMVAGLVGFPPDFSVNSPTTLYPIHYYPPDGPPGGTRYANIPPMVVNAAFQPLYRKPEDDVDGIGAMVGLTLDEVLAGWRAPTKEEGTWGDAVRAEDVKKRKWEGENDRKRKMKRAN